MRMNEAAGKPSTILTHPRKSIVLNTAMHRNLRWKWIARLTVTILLMVAIGGCTRKKTEASNINFQRAINAYFYNHRDECLFTTALRFPDEVKVHEKDEMKNMDALAKAGLLTRIEV